MEPYYEDQELEGTPWRFNVNIDLTPAYLFVILILVITFAGEPDLLDAIIDFLLTR